MPATKNKFQVSFFQSYLKKEILPGKQAAHTCRKLDDMPKLLLPNINKIMSDAKLFHSLITIVTFGWTPFQSSCICAETVRNSRRVCSLTNA